jgi:two-component system OmpR family response regulator
MLLDAAWDDDFDPRANIIDMHMHMHRLRAKVDQGGDTPLIHTVAGAGYCIRASPP